MNIVKYLPDLVEASFKKDNSSLEMIAISLIRLIRKEEKYTNIADELSNILKKNQAGLYRTNNITRNTTETLTDDDFILTIYSDIRLDDLFFNTNILDSLEEIILSYLKRDQLEAHNINYLNKIIINGPPGVGKSSAGIAIANELELPCYIVKIPQLFSSYLGNSGKNIANLFSTLTQLEGIIIFDEFDSLAINRNEENENGEMRRIVNTILNLLDNIETKSIIIATTNEDHNIDSAFWRRFDKKITIDFPDKQISKKLWDRYTRGNLTNNQLDLIVNYTKSISPAEIEIYSEQALRKKILQDKPVFYSVLKQLNLKEVSKESKVKISHLLSENDDTLNVRKIADIMQVSKSSAQRYLKEEVNHE